MHGAATVAVVDRDRVAADVDDRAVVLGEQHVACVAQRRAPSTPVPMYGAVARSSGHGLTLHVGAHERTVRVVVLEERDQRGRDRNELLRRHVHVLNVFGCEEADLAAPGPHQHALVEEVALLVDVGVGLGDDVLVFVVGREVRRSRR